MSRAVAPLLLVALAACGGSGRTTQLVGPEGGFVRGDGVGLDVPPGALSSQVELTIERIPVPAGYRATGDAAWRFGPQGLVFAVPVTARFRIASGDTAPTVYWTSDAPGHALGALATRYESSDAVASVTHFSDGFAGWPVAGDGGELDAGDAGVDMPPPDDLGMDMPPPDDLGMDMPPPDDLGVDMPPDDLGVDSGRVDMGYDAGPPPPGITCMVWERFVATDCLGTLRIETPDFQFHVPGSGSAVAGELRSTASGLTRYASISPATFLATDAEDTIYSVGTDRPPGPGYWITRVGNLVTADFTVARGGYPSDPTTCPGGADPLIRVTCSGSDLVPDGVCPTLPDPAWFTASPLSCRVAQYDATCTSSLAMESPAFWFVDGTGGPASELHTDSPGLVALWGHGGPEGVLYREPSMCNRYLGSMADASSPFAGLWRMGDQIATSGPDRLSGSSSATCTPAGGTPQPLVSAFCTGASTLVPAP